VDVGAQLFQQNSHRIGALPAAYVAFQDNVDAAQQLGILSQVVAKLGKVIGRF